MGVKPSRQTLAKGAFLLPNALTTGALFAGFFAIISAIGDKPLAACVAVLVAGLLDGLDGRVARMTNTQSDFGVQYDSISDMVSFGLAPAVLVYTWALAGLADSGPVAERLGWLAAFFFTACAALRLARFNTQAGMADKRYFQGLASPAAAGMLIATIWFCISREIAPESVRWLLLLLTIVLGVLMFSRVRYFSFKAWPLRDRAPITWIFGVILVLVLLSIDLPAVLFAIGVLYVLSGPVLTFIGRQRHRRRRERKGAR